MDVLNISSTLNSAAGQAHTPITLPQWTVQVDIDRLQAQGWSNLDTHDINDNRGAFGPVTVNRRTVEFKAACRLTPTPVCVIVDGYLMDTVDIADKFGVRHDDTAGLVLAAFSHWGCRIFDHLDGGFLIAIWDGARGEFILGRDGVGKHPAYYSIQYGSLWMSSNILALSRCNGIPRLPNRLSIARRLLFRPPVAGLTFFSHIRRLRPGHFLRIESASSFEEQRYWQPLPEFDEPWLPDAAVLNQYEDLLTRATNRCLDLGAGGVLLSGGTDSVSVAALAASQARARLLAVPTACCGKAPPGFRVGSDEFMQDRVAELLHMPELTGHALDWLDGKDLIGASLSYTSMLPGPTTVYWMGAFCGFYRSITRQGIHTVMSGSGGDEWMGVHESYFTDLFWRLDIQQMHLFSRALATGSNTGLRRTVGNLIWRWAILYAAGTYLEKLTPRPGTSHRRARLRASLPDWLRSNTEIVDSVLADTAERKIPGMSAPGCRDRWYRHTVARLYDNPFMHYEMERRYHLGHALGLRLVSPFQDREVVHFFNRVSPATLIRTGQNKGLLRQIIDKHIGDPKVTAHPKSYGSENTYVHDQLRAHLARYVRAAEFAAVRELGLIDVDKLKLAARRLPAATHTEMVQIFGVLSIEKWLRSNF